MTIRIPISAQLPPLCRIEEFEPGCWQATIIENVYILDNLTRSKVREVVLDRREILVDDAIAELTRRGEMTGHEAIAARRRSMEAAV